MGKRTNKVSINLTQEQFDILRTLANIERRTISELAALIVSDVSRELFLEKQQQGKMQKARFVFDYNLKTLIKLCKNTKFQCQ